MMLQRVQRNNKKRRQVLISTHSDALLNNPGIDGRGIIMLEAGAEGSTARTVNSDEAAALRAGLSVAEVILPKTRKETTEQLRFW
jgi:predicted ATPase